MNLAVSTGPQKDKASKSGKTMTFIVEFQCKKEPNKEYLLIFIDDLPNGLGSNNSKNF